MSGTSAGKRLMLLFAQIYSNFLVSRSNIVHESTELIPDEVTVVIRRCAWACEDLYPNIQDYMDNDAEEISLEQHCQRADSESLSSHDNESLSHSSGRFAAEDRSWNQRHDSLDSINWTPCAEKQELLKIMKRSGGPAQVPGAVCVGASDGNDQQTTTTASPVAYASSPKKPPPLHREESKPGAVRVDGPGIKYNNGTTTPAARRETSLDDWRPDTKLGPSFAGQVAAAPSYAQAPAPTRSSFSIDSYFVAQMQQDNYNDDDSSSWSSGQIKAAAAAFGSSDIAPSSDKPTVQVTNDLELPLHGANETTVALETGNVVTVVCVVCRATLRCIAIAQYVLCPECKCLTPLENRHMNACGGVGLGLLSTYDQSYHVGVS